MTFANGWTVSVQWGAGNYCDNREHCENTGKSTTAEVAAWDRNDVWFLFDNQDKVKGYLNADEVAEFIGEIASKNEGDVKLDMGKQRQWAASMRTDPNPTTGYIIKLGTSREDIDNVGGISISVIASGVVTIEEIKDRAWLELKYHPGCKWARWERGSKWSGDLVVGEIYSNVRDDETRHG